MLLKRVLRRGIERRLLPATLDLDEVMALLLGPIFYMKIFQDVTPATSNARGGVLLTGLQQRKGNVGAGKGRAAVVAGMVGDMMSDG